MAAKGIVNLCAGRRELRLKAVAELSDVLGDMYRNRLDSLVSAYLQSLITSRL